MKKILWTLVIVMTFQTAQAQGEHLQSNPENDNVYTRDFVRITPIEYRHNRFGKVEIPEIKRKVASRERVWLNGVEYKHRLFRDRGTGHATTVVHVPWVKTGPEFKHIIHRKKILEGAHPE